MGLGSPIAPANRARLIFATSMFHHPSAVSCSAKRKFAPANREYLVEEIRIALSYNPRTCILDPPRVYKIVLSRHNR